jgi:hypothetical protein
LTLRTLLLLASLVMPAATRAPLGAAPGALRAVQTTHGLRFEITVPAQTYPQDALVQVTASMRNVSSHPLKLQKTCDYGYLWVEIVDEQGRVVFPPATPNASSPTCTARQSTTVLRPGQSRQRSAVVLLRAEHLHVVGSLASGRVIGTAVTVQLGPATPRPTVTESASGDVVTISPAGPVHGSLYTAVFTNCYLGIANVLTTIPRNRTDWVSNGSRVVGPDACVSDVYGTVSWQVVAGWIGQSAVIWNSPSD